MVFLENIMVGIANPWEGAQDRNDNENVGYDAANENSLVLNGTMPNNVDDFINQPAAFGQSNSARR